MLPLTHRGGPTQNPTTDQASTLPLTEARPSLKSRPSAAGVWAKSAAALALIAIFGLCVWYSFTHGALAQARVGITPSPLNLLVATFPPVACWVAAAWTTRSRWWVALAGSLLIVALLCSQHGQIGHIRELWLLDHLSGNLALAVLFGRSLAPGRKPLVSRFAEHLHGPLTPLQIRYTRRVTAAWTLNFLLVAAASVALFFSTSFAHWTEFAWFSALPLSLFWFLLEFVCRCFVIPKHERSSFMDTLRVVSHCGFRPGSARDGALTSRTR